MKTNVQKNSFIKCATLLVYMTALISAGVNAAPKNATCYGDEDAGNKICCWHTGGPDDFDFHCE